MATITPHRDAVEEGLDAMRSRLEKGPAADEMQRVYRKLTIAFTEAAMRELGDARDRAIGDQIIGGAFSGALGNVVASLCETIAGGDHAAAQRLVHVTLNHAFRQASRGIADQDAQSVNEVRVDQSQMGRA